MEVHRCNENHHGTAHHLVGAVLCRLSIGKTLRNDAGKTRLVEMNLKPEGGPFVAQAWEPKHPAENRNCELLFREDVRKNGNPHGARGDLWQWLDHCWTCYMRIRPNGEFEHIHRHFLDVYADQESGRPHTHPVDMHPDIFTATRASRDECWCRSDYETLQALAAPNRKDDGENWNTMVAASRERQRRRLLSNSV